MTRYVVTSTQWGGSLTFAFNKAGHLTGYTDESEMGDDLREKFGGILPTSLNGFLTMFNHTKYMTGRLIEADLSFGAFWEAYDYKVDKKLAEAEWNKLVDAHKLAVLNSIPAYNHYLLIHPHIQRIYPVRYLKNGRWEVDYKALTKAKSE